MIHIEVKKIKNFSRKSVKGNKSYMSEYLQGWWISYEAFPFAIFKYFSSQEVVVASWTSTRYSGMAAVYGVDTVLVSSSSLSTRSNSGHRFSRLNQKNLIVNTIESKFPKLRIKVTQRVQTYIFYSKISEKNKAYQAAKSSSMHWSSSPRPTGTRHLAPEVWDDWTQKQWKSKDDSKIVNLHTNQHLPPTHTRKER